MSPCDYFQKNLHPLIKIDATLNQFHLGHPRFIRRADRISTRSESNITTVLKVRAPDDMMWALCYIAPMLLLFEHLALFCQLGVKYARYVSEVEKNYERQTDGGGCRSAPLWSRRAKTELKIKLKICLPAILCKTEKGRSVTWMLGLCLNLNYRL